jgi:hypothetical protein
MDCEYGPDGGRSERRITVVLPGHPRKCYMREHSESRNARQRFICEIQPDPDGSLAAVVWRMAEPITAKSALSGLRLGMSLEEIRGIAGIKKEEGHDNRFMLDRAHPPTKVILDADSGKVREIIQFAGEGKDASTILEQEAIIRFGFGWQWAPLVQVTPTGSIDKRVWRSADGQILVEFHPPTRPDEPASVRLLRTASEQPDQH